jgi:hypothetical protein
MEKKDETEFKKIILMTMIEKNAETRIRGSGR